MFTVLEYNGDNKIETDHVYCANLEANDILVKGHRLLDLENKCVGLLSLDKKIEWNIKKGTIRRCEHNCHLCKKEWLGRCFGKWHGKDISIEDMPICEEYIYGGSEEHLREIEYSNRRNILTEEVIL